MKSCALFFISAILCLVVPASAQAQAASGWGVVAQGKWGTLWSATPLVKIMRDTPIPSAKAKGVRIFAARNEYEPFQLVLTPKTGQANVRVVPHGLAGPKGAKIEAWNISVKNVEYVNCVTPTSEDAKPGWYPDPLPDHTPFAAPKGQNRPVWLTVYVTPKTPPGEYKGTVDVIASGMGKVTVPLSVRVWSFALPSVSRLKTAYGNSMSRAADYQGAATIEQRRKLTDLYNLDFYKHRVSPYSPWANYDIKVTPADGTVDVDFTDFDVAIRKHFAMFNSFMLPRFGMGDNVGLEGGDAKRMKIDYMRQVAEHLVDKGQLAKGYDYITDEPPPDKYDEIVEAAKDVRLADQRIKILLTKKVEDKLIGSVDIWVPIGPDYDEQRSIARQAEGEEVWWYLCCWPHHPWPNGYFIDYPAMDLRMYHWLTWRYGLDGILYWDTMYWQDNPWNIPMSQTPDRKGNWGNGDGHLLYPPVKTPSAAFVAKGPVDSIRWETIRDGIEDWDTFRILQDKMKAAPASKRSSAAYSNAEEALKQVDDCVKTPTQYCKDPVQAEAVRLKVAQAIEGLK